MEPKSLKTILPFHLQTILIHPTYFSPIAQYAAILQAKEYQFEITDNFQKQTYRTRCYICGPNGKQLLNVPIKHDKTQQKIKTKDIKIDNETSYWQQNHIRSFQAAYRSSPFFEYYIDDMLPLFEKKHTYLLDLNLATHSFIMEAFQEKCSYSKSSQYQEFPIQKEDFRILVNAKTDLQIKFPEYVQIFDDKHGFQPNLSILDLLFMEGPNTSNVLSKLDITSI